ncbi:MAG: Guanidinopropionase [Alphaproteobacteria bacterium MarineAlpha5_Bin5]|nr:MAG: Guanidinopropionase [Alphaproteobacteria bacterium MarineAlpha5_Bin5]PPR51454.1 MAG: Guanidinopropionase [Alphaproteobacteria bacterium MarineAlpha5_Bin4]|tara:strand:- start:2114 stop:3088 length:975 start_codon:yes stop_codon:yes gene_type:complete
MSKSNDELMMETMYWWGIPTLFRCPHQTDPSKCNIALAGVPHSTGNGTTERDQHLGPRAVRHVSSGLRRVHLDFNFNPWEKKVIHDLGDVPLPEANNNEKCIEDITDYYANIANLKKPVVSIGGDHSITGGILQGLGTNNLDFTKGQKISFLHIDAHIDTYNQLDHFLGAKKSAAHWGSYLVKDGIIDASSSMQIGIRGNPRSLDWLKPSYDLGYNVVTMQEFQKRGIEDVINETLSTLGDNPIYITFDLDSLDAAVAPAVSNLEPSFTGFTIDEAKLLIQSVKNKNVIGGDVVCLMPTKDSPNNITAMVAASIMFEIISVIAF